MKTHKIKLDIAYCDDVLSGSKSFEIRLNDRGYQTGDYIIFMPVEKGKEINHPIMDVMYKITYILNGKGLHNDYVVFAIKEVK